eukprot:gene12455-8543_t
MATLNDLYSYYCRRWDCRPNSSFAKYLEEAYNHHGQQRILHTVDVSSNYLGHKGIIPVLDLVKNTKTVKVLDVSNNRLEHEQLVHLCYCLAKHPSIRQLSVSNNLLHDASIGVLVELLEMNPSIIEVDISGNQFLPSSFALIRDCVSKNQYIQKQLADEEAAIEKLRRERPKPSYQTEVEDTISVEESGGDLHFSTWYKNPQYSLRVSKDTRVSVVLKVLEENEAKQSGFVLMRYDGIRRVVELGRKTVVVESPVSCSHTKVEVLLEKDGQYVVMPYTFHPQRSLRFQLSATILRDKPTLDEGWITLDKLDAQYDWFTQTIEGAWKGQTAGGDTHQPTWRYNDMYRIQYAGPQQSFALSSKGMVCLRLFKSVDPDDNDEKEIGLEVMEHDTYASGLPPLLSTPDVVRTSYLHEHKACIVHKVGVQRAMDLDYFIVPSTKRAGQEGKYTLVVFSTVPFTIVPSYFPHRWNYRLLDGEWNNETCGGCREFYQSWKSNPSAKLVMEIQDKPKPIIVCLDMGENRGMVKNEAPHAEGNGDNNGGAGATVVALHADPDDSEGEFLRRHRECVLEGSVAAVDARHPKFALRKTTKMSAVESTMTLLDTSPTFYLVPMARHVGQLGTFKLHIFCEDPFVVDSVEPLASRERRAQLEGYEAENQKRRSTKSAISSRAPSTAQSAELLAARSEILRKCLTTGIKFSDRDFPRGFSSCWLQPDGPPPIDFPETYSWIHASDIAPGAGCLVGGAFSPPFPWGKRHWFGSVMNAVAAKPHMLSRIFLHYDSDAGFAQFQFFKGDRWIGVTVDDYLLVDAAGQLLFGHSINKSDILYPLMEKAYAKLHRCYEAMELKVTPELTLMDVLLQGLKDATGGHNEVYTLNPEKDVELTVEERESIWRVLKRSTSTKVLQTLLLRSDDPGVGERKHGGILEDHLYGVMDARFIEQQRLVKIRNWHDPIDADWRGKWAPHSPHWTDTLLEVLEYDHTQEEIWLSFDEVLHYFSNLIVTEEGESVSTIKKDFQVGVDAIDVDRRLRFPQFALNFNDLPPAGDNTPFKVVVELQQPDARMTVTRVRHATAQYATSIGLAVLTTEDNRRRVKALEDEYVLGWIRPQRCRDLHITLELHPALMAQQHLTLVPFLEDERHGDRTAPYFLRVSSSDVKVELTPVEDNTVVTLKGDWLDVTAGGPPQKEVTWRDNPQYFIYPSESMEITFTLSATAPPEKGVGIGFTVHETKLCSSFLSYDPETVVLHVPPTSPPSPVVAGAVKLKGMVERRGMPYVVVPYCNQRHFNASFELQALGNRKMTFAPIDPRLDWSRDCRVVKLRTFDGNTGGSPEYPSWRMNPQFVLDFPILREGRLFISAENLKAGDRFNKLGLLLLRADNRWNGLRRRRIAYRPEDVVAQAAERLDRVDLDVELDLRDHNEPLILVVYTNIPYREVDIRVTAYAAVPMEVEPVQEWKCTAITEGSWKLGITTGGSRKNFASWINNPFLGLSCIRPTQMMAVLIQYPHGPEKPIVKRYKNKKNFLPPPIVNPHLRQSIELDVLRYDDDLTPIASTGPVHQHEVVLAAKLEPCVDRPYLLVPATTLPEQNGDFKVLVYADHPVDLYTVDKPRLPYV